MNNKYSEEAELFKILSDSNRLKIIDMLSCGEMCACKILEKFDITQPTLSHHMKVLIDSGLVESRKESNWVYYKLKKETFKKLIDFIQLITNNKNDCICK